MFPIQCGDILENKVYQPTPHKTIQKIETNAKMNNTAIFLKLVLVSFLLILLCACGAYQKPASTYYESAAAPIGYPQEAQMRQAPSKSMAYPEQAPAAPSLLGGQSHFKNQNQVQAQEGEIQDHKAQPPKKVVYQGNITLRVKQLRETLDSAVKEAEKVGGFVESMGSRFVILRVPVQHFDATFQKLISIGLVVSKSIDAIDISAQYSDLEAHLKVSKDSRDRLLKILESTTKMDERLAILREIKRLTDEIESMSASLETFNHHLSYSTLTLNLVPYFEGKQIEHRSPFAWIKSLNPLLNTLGGDQDDIQIKLPKSFVQFEKKKAFEAISAKGATIRISKIPNEPKGDLLFWTKAIEYELVGRGDQLKDRQSTENDKKQPIQISVYGSPELRPYFYAIALLLDEDDLLVFELYLPNEDAKQAYDQEVLDALKSLSLK
jgi:hypothetical protein